MNARRPYVPPTLTVHGDAVARTTGRFGWAAELISFRIGLPWP